MESDVADVDKPRVILNDYHHYKPLDMSKKEIRLLRILPAESPKDELVCYLVRADLDNCPPYHALSYTLGSLDDTVGVKLIFRETLYVDSSYPDNSSQAQEEDKRIFESHKRSVVDNFQITTNLHAGLRSFRLNNETHIFIWVDMLCINQFDLNERSYQVRFMDQVFSRATRVIAWLGGDPESPSDIFSGQVDALTTLHVISRVDEMFMRGLRPSRKELRNFAELLQDQPTYNRMLRICAQAKSMHREAANRQPTINVVDLYIAFVYIERMFFIPENMDDLPSAAALWQFFFGLGSLLDQDTYVWQSLFIRLIAGASLHDVRSVWDDVEELLLRSEVHFTVLDRIVSLFNVPWFHRIWVIQEVTLNPNVYARRCNITAPWEVVETCGSIKGNENLYTADIRRSIREKAILDPTGTRYPSLVLMPWETDFADFADVEKYENTKLSIFWNDRRKTHLSICRLVRSIDLFDATVPRDKLYAIYHLAADLPDIEFSPDYGQALEASYASFTRQVIKATGSLEILLFAIRQPAPKTWTWVPDYHGGFSLPWRLASSWRWSSESAFLYQARLYKSIYTLAEEAIILRGAHIASVSCMVQPQKLVTFPAVWKSLLQGHERVCWRPISTCIDDHSEVTKLSVTDYLDVLLKLATNWTSNWFGVDIADEAKQRSKYAAFWIAQEPDLHSLASSPTAQAILRQLAEGYPAEVAKEQLGRWYEFTPGMGLVFF
jgi:hypothetical protein